MHARCTKARAGDDVNHANISVYLYGWILYIYVYKKCGGNGTLLSASFCLMGCVSKFSHLEASMTAGPAKNDRSSLLPNRGQFLDLQWVSSRAASGESHRLSLADTVWSSELTVGLTVKLTPMGVPASGEGLSGGWFKGIVGAY